MLIIEKLCLAFGTRKLFDNIDLTVNQDQKIGLVGRNGAGKSTLLKAIAGFQAVDSGTISIQKGKKIAYLPQDVVLLSSKTILDEAFSVFADVFTLKQELDKLDAFFATHDIATADPATAERYVHLVHELSDVNIPGLELKTKKILSGLGLGEERWSQRVDQLSVGWKMRLVLAKLLLQDADLYLFDEPTNHLDIVAKDWFLEFLQNASFGFLLVSHDRYFLDHACNFIFEVERGRGKMYYGNYSKYIDQKAYDTAMLEKAYEAQQKEIKQKMDVINRFKASASRASQMQSMQKSVDKIERIEIEKKSGAVRFTFAPVARAGNIILTVENVAKSFDNKKIFENVSFEIFRDEKVALIAANGVGKTTLLNIAMGKIQPDKGTITFGHNVTTALFEQDQERSLNQHKTILEEVEDSCLTSSARASMRAFLGAFLFPGDDVHKKISVLSGGEKNRVAMVKVLLAQANFLMLDEPTNHLDLESKEILLKGLQQYAGTILFVSHDRDFLDHLATRIIELTPTGVRSYKGNYESYLFQKNPQGASVADQTKKQEPKQEQTIEEKKRADKAPVPAGTGKEAFEARKKRNNLESKIEKLEKEIAFLQQKFGSMEYGSPEFVEAEKRFDDCKRQLAAALVEWEKVS